MVFKENNCKQNETGFVKKKKRNNKKKKRNRDDDDALRRLSLISRYLSP